MTEGRGKVYIIGAGPGDASYLTVRGEQLLAQAEVVVYDALVDPRLLASVPEDCRHFHVGKRGGKPSTPQVEIDQLLVAQCRQGKRVVRLKGGDPFIFGRTSSEIQALVAAGCPFEVVPGISSALAAPLLAGIPLTDRVLSGCFAVLSAHQPETMDWEALARLDTLVILMGGRQLKEISQQLQRYGKSPQTPVAAIRACGRPQQQVWTGTLADIVRQTQGVALSPVVLVIGEVVGLQDYLRSHNGGEMSASESAASLPLQGITVLVTRSAGQSSQFTELLEGEGAKVVEMPALEITPPSSWEELDRAIANLSEFDWLMLTSSNGVDYFCDRLLSQGKDTRALAGIQIAAVGKKTAASLKERGLQPDFIPPDFVADSLVENFPEPLTGKAVLFPRVESGGRETLVQGMQGQGAQVREVAAYQSGCPAQIEPTALDALQQQRVDVITFASSKTAKHFLQLLKQSLPNETELSHLLANPAIASIGPQTSLTCRQLFGRVDIEAQEYTLEGLTQGIVQWMTDNNRHI